MNRKVSVLLDKYCELLNCRDSASKKKVKSFYLKLPREKKELFILNARIGIKKHAQEKV